MMPLMISEVPLMCINSAAQEYHIPAKIMVAVLNVERGRIGTRAKNKNGSYDLGPFQVNSRWLPIVAHYGYTANDVTFNACKNTEIAAWILARSIADSTTPFFWNEVADYHSHTPNYNHPYAVQLEHYWQVVNELSG